MGVFPRCYILIKNMGRSLKKKKVRDNKAVAITQEKIMRRLQKTAEIVSNLSLEELLYIVKSKKVNILEKGINFNCSSTDLVAVHQVLKKKYVDDKQREGGQTGNI